MTTEEAVPWKINIRNNDSIENLHGLTNRISTTKYTIFSWLPISILEQFRRIANVYFLVISIMMIIGEYAPHLFQTSLNPWTTLGTLLFVLFVTSIKEGYEDLQRARSDNIENTREVDIVTFEGNREIKTRKLTHEVKAGDIIKMTGRTIVPADMVLILTSNYADGNQCYTETANIDGETNLKVREAPAALKTKIPSNGSLTPQMITGSLEFEPPNKNIHNFIGAITLAGDKEPIALCPDNILLRSSLFSNTEWGYGIAIYTGQETKVQMNNRLATSKMSKLEGYANVAIMVIFIAQLTVVSFAVIGLYASGYDDLEKYPYIFPQLNRKSLLPLWLEMWFSLFILYNNFIPISLYVTLEMVNIGQALLISYDQNIYEESIDAECTVKSSNMCQELGLISNIFSDKTGTLTRNEMKFVKFIIAGKVFDIPQIPAENSTPNPIQGAGIQIQRGRNSHVVKLSGTAEQNFVRCLTVCHTVVREKDGKYRAESPDELALVEGVDPYGCRLVERGTTSMLVDLFGSKKTFDIMAVNAFDADRKRMSILVRDTTTDEYFIYCKGADSVMLDLCKIDQAARRNVDKSLLDLACLGLRTLCIAQKQISRQKAMEFQVGWKEAASSLQNRAGRLAAIGASMELELELLGITAIEDRLQDEVPEVLAELAKAGIILWMLTGDKEETAVNIGRSCNLVKNNTKLWFITNVKNFGDFNTQLERTHTDVMKGFIKGVGYKVPFSDAAPVEVALVLDGPSFKYFKEDDKPQRKWLLEIGQCCRSVIACRLTPVQKQMLVGLVKTDSVPRSVTLAIGDGANDVSMIREADVGVGIIGKEGRQAANTADFAIGQFKFLRRLLLVHGRWNYIRQSKVFLYCLHKNMTITLTLFFFSFYSLVSAQTLYESWVYTSFNFALGLPIVFFGMMDRDVSEDYALKNPQIYSTGKLNTQLSVSAIALWVLNAIFLAIIVGLIFFVALQDTFSNWDLYSFGTSVFIALIFGLQMKVSFLHNQWNYINVVVLLLSILGLYIWILVVDQAYDLSAEYFGCGRFSLSQRITWLFCTFTIPVVFGVIDLIGQSIYLFFHTPDEMVFRESSLEDVIHSMRHWYTCGRTNACRRDGLEQAYSI